MLTFGLMLTFCNDGGKKQNQHMKLVHAFGDTFAGLYTVKRGHNNINNT